MTVLRRILWGLGWGTAGLLIGAFLIGYAAPYLAPVRFWWTDLFAVFLPPLGLAVGAVGVGLCVRGVSQRKWGRVGLAAALFVLLAMRFGPRLAAWGASESSAPTLQVMSFNVPPQFQTDRVSPGAITALMRREAPDVLAFQEARIRTGTASSRPTLVHASPPLEPLLNDSTEYTLPQFLPSNAEVQQPVLGALPLDSTSIHPLPPDGEGDARSRYTRTTFTWDGTRAVLYNVHLHTIGMVRPWTTMSTNDLSLARWRSFLQTYRKGALRRAQQARLIRRRIERESRPVLVVGDFNSTPHQWAYRHIARGLTSAANQGIRGWTATFPAQRPLVRIDHILAGPAWAVVTARVPKPEEPGLSDHRPVVAHFRWAEKRD